MFSKFWKKIVLRWNGGEEIILKEVNNVCLRKFGVYKRFVINMFYVYVLMFVCYVLYLVMFFVI